MCGAFVAERGRLVDLDAAPKARGGGLIGARSRRARRVPKGPGVGIGRSRLLLGASGDGPGALVCLALLR